MARPPGTTVQVDVTPLMDDGTNAICAIEGRTAADQDYVKGGVLNLEPTGAPYTVEFHLQPGIDNGQPSLQFDAATPWSCNHGSCPAKEDHNPNMHPGLTNGVLTVSPPPGGGGGKNAIYYSLNFSNGSRFDPIIIIGSS